MLFRVFSLLICIYFLCFSLNSQTIYYKTLPFEKLKEFSDTNSRLIFSGDTNFRSHFNYVLRFFAKMQYSQITIVFKEQKNPAKLKPGFATMFQAPQNRKYKLVFSSNSVSALDSIILKHLDLNSQLGLIARQIGCIDDLSTGGFFDNLFWHFKQLSKRAKNKLTRDIELKVLEAGLGYQLLSLSKRQEDKLSIDKWNDAKAYAAYFKQNKKRYMDPETIRNFINDLPVYATHSYK